MVRIEPSSPVPESILQLFTSRNLAMPHQSVPPTRCQATSAGLLSGAEKVRVVQAAGWGVWAFAAAVPASIRAAAVKIFFILLPPQAPQRPPRHFQRLWQALHCA